MVGVRINLSVRALLGICVLLVGGCAQLNRTVGTRYVAPHQLFTLSADRAPFRAPFVIVAHGDNELRISDAAGNAFALRYFQLNQHPLALVPQFASVFTIAKLIYQNDLREHEPAEQHISYSEALYEDTVDTANIQGYFSVSFVETEDDLTRDSYYLATLVFQRGEYAFILQTQSPYYAKRMLQQQLLALADNLSAGI
jgi:hypothetical protein